METKLQGCAPNMRVSAKNNTLLQGLGAQFLLQIVFVLCLIPLLYTAYQLQAQILDVLDTVKQGDFTAFNQLVKTIVPQSSVTLWTLPLLLFVWWPLSMGVGKARRDENPVRVMLVQYPSSLAHTFYKLLRLLPLFLLPPAFLLAVYFTADYMTTKISFSEMTRLLGVFGTTLSEMLKGLLRAMALVSGSFLLLWLLLLLNRCAAHASYPQELRAGRTPSEAWRVGARHMKGKKLLMVWQFVKCLPLYLASLALGYLALRLTGHWVYGVLTSLVWMALPLTMERYLFSKL